MMTTFVLVHGAWHGGWCWKRVAALLRQAGHEVFAPTLTGLGERAHLMSDAIDLHTHIQDILGVLQCEELADVVLCGHSYGGMVISGVADRVPEKLRSLTGHWSRLPTASARASLPLPATAHCLQPSLLRRWREVSQLHLLNHSVT